MNIGADFLEEHMFEIQTLCQHLEKSIYTNDLLRKQLEIYLTSMAKSNGAREAESSVIGMSEITCMYCHQYLDLISIFIYLLVQFNKNKIKWCNGVNKKITIGNKF